MTRTEKETLFNLLKTADSYSHGYETQKFAFIPEFTDDQEIFSESTGQLLSPQKVTAETKNEELKTGTQNPAETKRLDTSIINENIQKTSISAAVTEKTGISFDELKLKIERCTRCSLARTRNNVVPGMGVLNPQVLVIGEGPGEEEDLQGKPFVGRAGILLDKMLAAIGLDRNKNCYIANIVKCRPPQNRNPFPDEQSACFGFLQTQIHLLKPKMILCMGKIAIEKLMDQKISINQSHGCFFDYNGIPVMVTYHPSALLRDENLKRPAWNDLKGFKARLDNIKQ